MIVDDKKVECFLQASCDGKLSWKMRVERGLHARTEERATRERICAWLAIVLQQRPEEDGKKLGLLLGNVC